MDTKLARSPTAFVDPESPIMLAVTTFLGFTPLILERGIQAQFLIPFAASLGCGVLSITAILVMVVPVLYTLHLRLRRSWRRSGTRAA